MNRQGLNYYFKAFAELFFPRICRGCGNHLFEHEHEVCSNCLRKLPRTGFELIDDNPVSKMFWGRIHIEKAASLYYYRKGELLQKLLHKLKYKGNYHLGEVFGQQAGKIFLRSGFTADVDAVVAVPLHEKKRRERGYNQSEIIAKGISEVTKIPFLNGNLIRTVYTESQTQKGRFERWENVKSVFNITHEEELQGKHILLVDDVITTGATLEACASALKKAGDVKVSIVTIGMADI